MLSTARLQYPTAKHLILLLTVFCACVVLFGFGARAWLITSSPGNGGNNSFATRSLSRKAELAASFRQSVRVWVHADRVSPDLIYARPGKLILEAENETSVDINLKFERQVSGANNQLQGVVRTTRRGKRGNLEVELGAGEYVFYDESRPSIKGRLIVDPSIR